MPPSWPVGDAYLKQNEAALPSVSYRDVFRDARLQTLIDRALANNRDLRAAVANIAVARAQYRIQRSELFPVVNAGATATQREVGQGAAGGAFQVGGRSYQADIGVTGFELDLFGRVRSLTDAALARYFGQEAAARSVRLTLVGDVATAWLTYAADKSLLAVAQETAANAQRGFDLTELRRAGGISPRSDVRQAEQVLASAQASIASQKTAIAQDLNALQLLVGAPVDPALLPATLAEVAPRIAEVPAGTDSRVLLRRPDVVQAEYELRAGNAEIGAARAALFPTISLTGLVNFAATTLSSLFAQGSRPRRDRPRSTIRSSAPERDARTWSFPQAQRDALLAQYEGTIQTASGGIRCACPGRGTITDELAARQRFLVAARDTYNLANLRYTGGVDTYLSSLDAQRQLFSPPSRAWWRPS
ncbi:efflux transporter outer membrane subunit [Sphingomonas sp. MMS24-JH45]